MRDGTQEEEREEGRWDDDTSDGKQLLHQSKMQDVLLDRGSERNRRTAGILNLRKLGREAEEKALSGGPRPSTEIGEEPGGRS